MAKFFWVSPEGAKLDYDACEDVLQVARRLLLDYPYNPSRKGKNGKPVKKESYYRQLFPTAYKVWKCNEGFKFEAELQRQAEQSLEFKREESTFDEVPDPLSQEGAQYFFNGAAVLFDEPALEQELQAAPFKIVFTDPSDAGAYVRKPFFVPYFDIVPKYKTEEGDEVLAYAKRDRRRGKRKRFTKRHLPTRLVNHLEARRSRFAGYLRELIPHYLRNFGFFSLDRRYWGLIADINTRGMSPKEIQRERKLSENTYYAQIATLGRRGWRKVWNGVKQREILLYFPAFDRCKRLHSSLVLDLESMTVGEVLNLCGPALADQLYSEEVCEQAIQGELRKVRTRLREALHSFEIEEEYDRKLRGFIMDLIDRPVKTGMPLDELEEKFRHLTLEMRISLFCEALRKGISIFDAISQDFNALYADVLKPREQKERAELEETLQTLLLAFEHQGVPA